MDVSRIGPLTCGAGNSPLLSLTLKRRSFIAPSSFHLIPESSTAIVTSGRPVDVSHAAWMGGLLSARWPPRTPFSSIGSPAMFGGAPAPGVDANFQSLPSPPMSFGTPAGPWSTWKKLPPDGLYGKLASPGAATAHAIASAPASAMSSLLGRDPPTRAAVLHGGCAR